MKIAQVAPLFESVPPKTYGGTERVVSWLTEELVRQGHEVTLFASGDSETAAELVPVVPEAIRLAGRTSDPAALHVMMLGRLAERAGEFDCIHFHVDYLHFPMMRRLEVPHVTTMHGRLDLPELAPLFSEFPDMPVVSISNDQRRPLPHANWQATVYNGMPADLFRFNPHPGDYLAFLGRISPEKGIEAAIDIAVRSGLPLKIAAKVDNVDREYFENVIKPRLSHPLIEFIGEVGGADKERFLAGARALLFPINWPEPFGLVMIEAMACGTPVIAFRRGSVPEVMVEGRSGFIVNGVNEAVAAVNRIGMISRRSCRQVFEEHFTSAAMAAGYLEVYRRLIDERLRPRLAV